ncbi:hypothetical protein M1M40_gp26 [Halorubrum tailed virus 29]|uniref:Uncharacterized protein n=1 Tax=Halorubrum tailed virus 29 TaxID=2878010 RepID=A0AAE9BYV0_9CAUD|nr:hypothetical protein M1M40_gp26 [Halorubrum tailed virus 29]UBF23304.1 hypothetical protein HRTV-29_gp26 [Halorubrum tailed virus 29]
MSDNTKDWANIRIEEPVRDEARDDPRTYSEIMRAGLEGDEGEVETGGAFAAVSTDTITADLPAEVCEQLDRIEDAAKEATQAAQAAERATEELQR